MLQAKNIAHTYPVRFSYRVQSKGSFHFCTLGRGGWAKLGKNQKRKYCKAFSEEKSCTPRGSKEITCKLGKKKSCKNLLHDTVHVDKSVK